MLDTITRPEAAELQLEAPTKRELVEKELLENPERSDREIGRICACDHKTVSAARARLGSRLALPTASPPTAPDLSGEINAPRTPLEKKLMESMAGRVDVNSPAFIRDLAAVTSIAVREELGLDVASDDDFDWGAVDVGLREQRETAIYKNPAGSLVIRQYAYPDEDPCIVVAPENIQTFLDKICDVCGIGEVHGG